jgi:type IV pilus assembly protein PilW
MRNRGFSLIELMIAITLGMLAVAAVGSVFIYGSRNYKQDDKVSRMQDELRFAMAQLTQDIEMAGYYAQVRDLINDIDLHSTATVANAQADCGPTLDSGSWTAGMNWAFRERRAAVFTHGNATTAQANATFPCIPDSSDEFLAGTDILALKRLSSATKTVVAGKAYLRTNGVESTLYVATTNDQAGPDPLGVVCDPATTADDNTCTVTIYEYRPVVWYIRPYSTSPTENPRLPALCRKVFAGGAMTTDTAGCIASGIANMQLEFGFDVPDGTGRYDGLADNFQEIGAPLAVPLPTSSTPHPMAAVVAVRVHLLAQSAQSDVDYRNTKLYQLTSTTSSGPHNDGFYRKSLSSTVLIRNVMNRLSPYSLPSY